MGPPKCQSLDESGSERPHLRLKPSLTRSRTCDPSFSRDREKESVPAHGPNLEPHLTNLMKHNIHFRHVFKDIPPEEELLDTFSCAWQREVAYHGWLYVSHRHVCFYCSMIRREVKVTIPVSTISGYKKANTALLVPNAICIRTSEGEKFVFTSLRSRESVYQLLRSVCGHLQDGSRNSSLTSSYTSSENLLKQVLQDPSANPFSPEHGALQEEPDEGDETDPADDGPIEPPFRWPDVADGRGDVANGREHLPKPSGTQTERFSHLKMIIFIYLFLVVVLILSSGYIGLRIVQLEEQLTSMGAWPEFRLQHRYKQT